MSAVSALVLAVQTAVRDIEIVWSLLAEVLVVVVAALVFWVFRKIIPTEDQTAGTKFHWVDCSASLALHSAAN
ncbi:Uncharacterized protein TSPI_06367 [Trichinella spiralis]|uniref:Uncharacterized protein n=1 Tax=Trichinella spiralis TaxID=6334 RepID=A0ABR3KZI6_TRISP